MTRFTDSPYEYLMTQRPYAGKEADAGPPPYPLHRRVHERTAPCVKKTWKGRCKNWERHIKKQPCLPC